MSVLFEMNTEKSVLFGSNSLKVSELFNMNCENVIIVDSKSVKVSLLVNVNSEKVSVLFSSNSLRVPVLLISWIDLCFVGFLWTAYIFKWVAEYYSYLHLFSQLYFNRKWVIPLKLYFRGYCPKELRSKGVFIIKQTWIN